MNVKNLFKNLSYKIGQAQQSAKEYTDSFYSFKRGTGSVSLTTEYGCGYLILAPAGSSIDVYFVNNYQNNAFSKNVVKQISSFSVGTSGATWILTNTTGNSVEYYAIKIGGVTKLLTHLSSLLYRKAVMA